MVSIAYGIDQRGASGSSAPQPPRRPSALACSGTFNTPSNQPQTQKAAAQAQRPTPALNPPTQPAPGPSSSSPSASTSTSLVRKKSRRFSILIDAYYNGERADRQCPGPPPSTPTTGVPSVPGANVIEPIVIESTPAVRAIPPRASAAPTLAARTPAAPAPAARTSAAPIPTAFYPTAPILVVPTPTTSAANAPPSTASTSTVAEPTTSPATAPTTDDSEFTLPYYHAMDVTLLVDIEHFNSWEPVATPPQPHLPYTYANQNLIPRCAPQQIPAGCVPYKFKGKTPAILSETQCQAYFDYEAYSADEMDEDDEDDMYMQVD